MKIDWFTFFAQIVNFLILMGLLWRFLYRPVMAAMNKREEEIASRFEEAESKRKDAEKQEKTFRQKRDELDERREDMLAEAKEEAQEEKKKMLDEARKEVDRARGHWRSALEQDQRRVLNRFREEAGKGMCSGVRKALQELADEELEPRIIDVFLERLSSLRDEERQALQESLDQTGEEPQVVSAFDLPQKKQKEVSQSIRRALDRDVSPEFRRSSEVTCGVELRTNGHKLAWSFAGFAADVAENLNAWLEEERQSTAAKEAKAEDDEGENAQDHEQDEHEESE